MNSLYFPFQDLNRWAIHMAMAVGLVVLMAFNPAKAIELKPIAINAASHSSTPVAAPNQKIESQKIASEKDADEKDQQQEQIEPQQRESQSPEDDWDQHHHPHGEMHHDSGDEERMAQEIAKSVVNQVMENMHHGNGPDFFNGSTVSLALLIPILAITFVIGGPIFIVIYLIRARYQTKQKRLEIINTNIDKLIAAGRDIPPELLRGDAPMTGNYTEMLHSGIKNVFVGLGVFLFLTIFLGIWIGSVGFIVMAVGLSQLAIWKISAPRQGAVQPQEKSTSENLF